MHTVTLMDYDDPRGSDMCKIWLYLAKRFNPASKITIFHAEKALRSFASCFSDVPFIRLDTRGLLSWKETGGFAHAPQEFILGIWTHFESALPPIKHFYVGSTPVPFDGVLPGAGKGAFLP